MMKAKIGVEGSYSLKVLDKHGKEKNLLTPEGIPITGIENKNLILDNWYNEANAGFKILSEYLYICVGTGTTPPQVTDTRLESNIEYGSRKSSGPTGGTMSESADGLTLEGRVVYNYDFGLGTIEGNISELGLSETFGSSTNPEVLTRTLVKDALGNPTTISVTSEDQLIITYNLDVTISYVDTTYTVDLILDGETTPTTITNGFCYTKPRVQDLTDYTDRIGVCENYPDRANNMQNRYDTSNPSISGSLTEGVTRKITIPTSAANYSTGIGCVGLVNNSSNSYMVCKFDPKIPKTSDHILEIELVNKFER